MGHLSVTEVILEQLDHYNNADFAELIETTDSEVLADDLAVLLDLLWNSLSMHEKRRIRTTVTLAASDKDFEYMTDVLDDD